MKRIKILLISLTALGFIIHSRASNPNDEIIFMTKKLSEKLGINVDTCNNIYLMATISNWIGTPYRYGRNTEKGTDCSGFVGNVFKEVYCINTHRSSAGIYNQIPIKVKKEDLEEGDLVFFKIRGNRISHVGIYLRDGYFVHASTQRGVIVSHLEEPYYKKYWYGGGRF